MVLESDAVLKLVPELIDDPPVKVLYQFIVPMLAVAASDTTPVPQTEPGTVEIICGIGFTVIVIRLLFAIGLLAQLFAVNIQLTTSELINVASE